MSNFLSVILAVIIALTSMCGGLGASGADKAVTVDAAVKVDGDVAPLLSLVGLPSAQAEKLGPVIAGVQDVLKAVSLRFSADASVGQMQVLANGEDLVSASVKANEAGDGWDVISTLFPSTKLSITNATLESFTSSMVSSVQLPGGFSIDQLKELNIQAVVPVVASAITEILAAFQASAGEPETGSFTVKDVEYTTKIPFNMTTKEAALLILGKLKDVLSDENVAALLEKLPIGNFSADKIDELIENVNSSEPNADLKAAMYGNEAGDTCLEILLLDETGNGISFYNIHSGNIITTTLDMLGMVNASLTIDNENKKYDIAVNISSNGRTVSLTGSAAVISESQIGIQASVSIDGKSFGADLTLTKGEGQFNLSGTVSVLPLPVTVNLNVANAETGIDLVLSVGLPMPQDAPVALTITGSLSYDGTPAFEASEDLTAVAFESLQEDEAAAAAFGQEIQNSVNTLGETLQQMFPALFEAIAAMNAPAEAPAPAEEAVPAE